MTHYSCDHRSDEQCDACYERQLAAEREADWPMPKPPPYPADDEGESEPQADP